MSSDPKAPPEIEVPAAEAQSSGSESEDAQASKGKVRDAEAPAPKVVEKPAKERRATLLGLSGIAIAISYFLVSNLLSRGDDTQRRVVEAPTQPAIETDFLVQEAERMISRDARLKAMEARKRKIAEAQRLAEQQQRLEALLTQRSSHRAPTASASRFSTLQPGGGHSARTSSEEANHESNSTAPVAEAIDRAALYQALSGEPLTTPPQRSESAASAFAPHYAALHRAEGVYLRAGTSIPATLLTRVLTGRPGPVQAVVAHDVYATGRDRRVLIPAGTRIFGVNDGQTAAGYRTLDVTWQRLIYQDGRTLMLQDGVTVSGDGAAGLRGKVDNHWPSLYGHAFLTSLTGAVAKLSQGRGRQAGEVGRGEEASSALGRNLADVTRDVARRNLQRQPTIDVPAGTSLAITLLEDLVFSSAVESIARSR